MGVTLWSSARLGMTEDLVTGIREEAEENGWVFGRKWESFRSDIPKELAKRVNEECIGHNVKGVLSRPVYIHSCGE